MYFYPSFYLLLINQSPQSINQSRYGGSSYNGGGGRAGTAAATAGYSHAGSSPGPADLYAAAATEYVQQATSPQPAQSNGYQMQMNRVR